MKLPSALGLLLAASLHAAPAGGTELPFTFVSMSGVDTGTCSDTSPCRTLQKAHDESINGGVIKCLDVNDLIAVTITKSITIDCTGHNTHLEADFSTVAITVDIALPNAVVILRGLNIIGNFADKSIGVHFKRGSQLHIENSKITGFANSGVGTGIYFTPSDASRLYVTDSTISVNGNAATGAGIIIKPTGSGSARVALTRVNVANNTFGIAADGTGSTAGINMTIADSMISGSLQDGIIAVTPGGGAPIGVMVKNTKSVNNNIGIRSIGPNVTVRVDGSSVIGNGTGLSFSGGGALLSFGNNSVVANGTNGAFSGSVALQ